MVHFHTLTNPGVVEKEQKTRIRKLIRQNRFWPWSGRFLLLYLPCYTKHNNTNWFFTSVHTSSDSDFWFLIVKALEPRTARWADVLLSKWLLEILYVDVFMMVWFNLVAMRWVWLLNEPFFFRVWFLSCVWWYWMSLETLEEVTTLLIATESENN